jgi:glutathione S-transferase
MEALETFRPDPPLYPSDEGLRRRAAELEDFFDEQLGHQLRAAILGPMFESDPEGVMAVLSLGMGLGEKTKGAVRALFPAFSAFYKLRHRINPTTISEAPTRVRAALDRITVELQPSGYLVGDCFTVADLTAAALFSPLVMPKEFQYPFPRPVPRSLADLQESLSGHRGFGWVAEIYRRHRGTSAEVPG